MFRLAELLSGLGQGATPAVGLGVAVALGLALFRRRVFLVVDLVYATAPFGSVV